MKILLVEPFGLNSGHPSVYTNRLCSLFAKYGHKVGLVSANGMKGLWESQIPVQSYRAMEKLPLVYGEHDHVNWYLRHISFYWTSWVVAKKALKVYESEKYDVIHFIDFEPRTLWRVVRTASVRLNLFLTLHYVIKPVTKGEHASENAFRRLSVNACTIVHSEPVKNSAIERQLASPEKIIQIPIGMQRYTNQISIERARGILGLGSKNKLLLIFGPGRSKDFATFFQALKNMPKTFEILIAGNFKELGTDRLLSSMIDDSGWESHIHWHNYYVPDEKVCLYFKAVNAVVLPYHKGFLCSSAVLAHACECGVPVIASDVGELGRIVHSKQLGLLVPPAEPLKLREAMTRFFELGEDDIERFRSNLLNFCDVNSLSGMAKNHIEVYEKRLACASDLI